MPGGFARKKTKMAVRITDKIVQGRVHMEPALYTLVQKTAQEEDISVSKWLRKTIISTLLTQGKLTNEQLVELAST